MQDKELCEQIGHRIKQRRTQLHLGLQYLADKMDVNKSTVQRYEAGTIDNSKKLVLEGLSEALQVSVEWLKGEADEYEPQVTDKRELQIGDTMAELLQEIHLVHSDMRDEELFFSEDLLLLMLREYMNFIKKFKDASEKYSELSGRDEIAIAAGFTSEKELNRMLFLRSIYHTTNTFSDISEIIRYYPENPKAAGVRLRQLLGAAQQEHEYI